MTPIVRLTAAFIAGDIVGLRWPVGGEGVALVVALVLLWTGLGRSGTSWRVLTAVFALLGWAGATHAARQEAADCRTRIADGARIVAVAALDGPPEPGAAVLLHLESLTIDGLATHCRGVVRARLPASASGLRAGAHVAVAGTWWSWPQRGVWPAQALYAGTLALRTVRPVAGPHAHPLMVARARALLHVRALFPTEAPLAEALILAHRESLDTALRDDFAASGLTHLLAISGTHVGILAAVVLLVARMLRLRQRTSAIVAVVTAGAYVLFLGAPAAAARAALQGFTLLASRLLQRPAEPVSLLASAALLLVSIDPLIPLDFGFQLSFAGVLGLVTFRRAAQRLLPRATPRPIATAMAATLAASFTTTPIAAWHFGLVSWVGPLTNLVAAPLLALAVPALILVLAVSLVGDVAAAAFAGGTEVLLRLLRATAHAGALVPGGHAWVAADAVAAALIAAAVFLVVAPARRAGRDESDEARVRRLRFRIVIRAAAAVAVLTCWPLLRPAGDGSLEIHAIDVGQGDAFAIRSPRGRWILVDAGPASGRFDAGRDRVAPYLLRRGVHVVDVAVLTHPHADHVGGIAAVWRRIPINTVVDPAVPVPSPLYLDLIAEARAGGRRWVAGRSGREVRIDGVALHILAPDDDLLLDVPDDPNDFSVVFRLEYGRFAALFLGDAPRAVENRLVARYGQQLAASLLKVGHHGSRTSTGDSLLLAVRPRIAIVPVGRRNRYGHPDPGVVDRLRRHGVQVVRTDEAGSVIVRAKADGALQLLTVR
jgi:competence protein ComEC